MTLFTRTAVLFFAGFCALSLLGLFDPRLFNGVDVWEKPAKFFLSLGLHMATLAFALTLVPEQTRGIRIASWFFVACAAGEMLYIAFRAARGEASHFNDTTPLAVALYGLMGLGAVTMTAITAYFGWRIRKAGDSVMHFAAGWSFIAAAIATTAVAGVMSSGTSHWVGGDQTDASGLAFFHWSTTGGDLRVPHFAALHIMQAVPLVAWFWPRKWIAIGAIAGGLAITGLLFVQALSGTPLFRA